MRRIATLTMAVAGLAATAAAANKYGTAGCGLGSMAFGDQKGMIQILAATTNGLFGTQTFGITTGTSNCADSGGGVASAKAFIETNREALAKDIARGQGETVKNLATLAGCSDAGAVGGSLQKSFSSIFPNASTPSEKVSESIVQTLRKDKALACGKLG